MSHSAMVWSQITTCGFRPTLSVEPERMRYSELGAKATVLISAVCASTEDSALLVLSDLVSQLCVRGEQILATERTS